MPNKLQFPMFITTNPRLDIKMCSECENAMFGTQGIFCRVYREDIADEMIAGECDDYEALPWAGDGK